MTDTFFMLVATWTLIFVLAVAAAVISHLDDAHRHRTRCRRCRTPIPPGGYFAGHLGRGFCHACAKDILREESRR